MLPKNKDIDRQIIMFIRQHKGKSGIIYCLSRKKVEELAEVLKANEIKLLTECVNEANMFTTTVSTKILTDFFNCKLDGVLKVNNTRLLAYLMMQLSCYNYIVYEWQSVIANNKLILKKIKGEPLTRTDLSSATDQAKNIYPKGYEIIDKYIKQLQKGWA